MSSNIHSKAISKEMSQPSITKICFKITYLKFNSNFPGANELNMILYTPQQLEHNSDFDLTKDN